MIKLSLSGRLFESPKGYILGREEFLGFARQAGYGGVELRYPQMPMETSAADVAEVRAKLAELGLTWVFGTVEGIHEPALYERALATMKQHVAGGALFTRFSIFKSEQIPLAQKFADEAARIGATLIMQMHAGTPADNVPHALDMMKKIDRPNVRLAFEPNHLVFDGDTKYIQAVAKLAPHIGAVSIQNLKPAPSSATGASGGGGESPYRFLEVVTAQHRGKDYVRAMPGDPAGIDFVGVFHALKQIGFAGWATLMCDCVPGGDPPQQIAKRWHDYLAPLC